MEKRLKLLRFFTSMETVNHDDVFLPDERRQWYFISNKRRKEIAKGLRGLLGRRQRLGSGELQGKSGSKARKHRS